MTTDQQSIMAAMQNKVAIKKGGIKIGRPGYKVTKIRDKESGKCGLLFQIMYPNIKIDTKPRYRFMSAFEQRLELPNKVIFRTRSLINQ